MAGWIRFGVQRELTKGSDSGSRCVACGILCGHRSSHITFLMDVLAHFSICACHPCVWAMLIFSV